MQFLAVNYHYFREEKPKSGIYPLTLKEFETQVETIAKYYEFVSESDILKMIENKEVSDRKCCLLTFDDGLKEQMDVANLLIRKGIPGMFYVSTGPLKNYTTLDVHKLHYIRSLVEDKHIYEVLDENFLISKYKFNYDFLENQYRYDNKLSREVKYFLNFVLNDTQKREIIDILFHELVSDTKAFSKSLYMDNDDLIKLSKYSILGTHGDTHQPLANFDLDEMKIDIEDSISYLKSVVNGDINSISYPYGGKSAVSEDVAKISQECGLKFGLTMFRGINNIKDLDNNFLLKRIDTNDAPGGKSKSEEFCI